MHCDVSCDYIIDLQYVAGRQLFESWWNDKEHKSKNSRRCEPRDGILCLLNRVLEGNVPKLWKQYFLVSQTTPSL